MAYSFILLGVGIQNALINSQVTVLAPKMNLIQKCTFVYSLYYRQHVYWVGISVSVIVFAICMLLFGGLSIYYFKIVVFTAIAYLVFLHAEYNRTVSFLGLRADRVLIQDLAYLMLLFLSFFVLYYIIPQHGAALISVYSIIIAGAILSVIIGYKLHDVINRYSKGNNEILLDCWVHGKWALLGVLVTWLESQSYIYLLSVIRGLSSSASANIARQFFVPIALFSLSFGRIFRPIWAKSCAEGKFEKVKHQSFVAATVLSVVIIVYGVTVASYSKLIISAVYTGILFDSHKFVLCWTVYSCLNIWVTNLSTLLQVTERFRHIALSGVLTAGVTIVCSIVFLKILGEYGTILAMCIGQALYIFLLWREL